VPPIGGRNALNQGNAGKNNREETGRSQPKEERLGKGRGTLISIDWAGG